jgi:hypothetical protein
VGLFANLVSTAVFGERERSRGICLSGLFDGVVVLVDVVVVDFIDMVFAKVEIVSESVLWCADFKPLDTCPARDELVEDDASSTKSKREHNTLYLPHPTAETLLMESTS